MLACLTIGKGGGIRQPMSLADLRAAVVDLFRPYEESVSGGPHDRSPTRFPSPRRRGPVLLGRGVRNRGAHRGSGTTDADGYRGAADAHTRGHADADTDRDADTDADTDADADAGADADADRNADAC